MPLIEAEPYLPAKKLLLVGLPAFILAAVVSTLTHQYAHIFASTLLCGVGRSPGTIPVTAADFHAFEAAPCALASLAGPAWTFVAALASFAWYMRQPQNLFIGALAFVNASTRLPETITVSLQLLFHNRAKLAVDESASLALLNLKDPTVSVVLMFFYCLVTAFLTVTIVHDTKTVPWKWLVALGLFVLLRPLEHLIWGAADALLY